MTEQEPSEVAEREPQDEVAAWYMTRKGFPDAEPDRVVEMEAAYVWYFYYELDEGLVELEVAWEEVTGKWHAHATGFQPRLD